MDASDERIRERAHQLWEEAGRPEGRAEQYWLAAEREMDAGEAGYDRALADSFPASDPPGNSGITGPEAVEQRSTETTAGQPAAGADPGGTKPTRPASVATATKPPSRPVQTVRSGDRNDAPSAGGRRR